VACGYRTILYKKTPLYAVLQNKLSNPFYNQYVLFESSIFWLQK